MSVIVETTKGVFTVDLYAEVRPNLCREFLKSCRNKFYNFSLFHFLESGFIAQTGKPAWGEDKGKPGRAFPGDAGKPPKISHNKRGLLSMVGLKDGGDANVYLPQFFLTLSEDLDYLDETHAVFGEIVENKEEILRVLNETPADKDHVPYQDLRITHTVVLEDPFLNEIDEQHPPPASPLPTPEILATTRIAADESFDQYEGKTSEEIQEIMKEKEAKAQATILEMVGDLPDADVAPPENVLFVCKLNPVTNDDDLEIIFSRFGKVVSCEVIRDRKTGDSLQYAFVEFENPEICERAYFKMDNVLIDDRRIKVDFSQSVSKYRWKGKGRLEIVDDKEQRRSHRNQSHEDDRRSKNYDRNHRNNDYKSSSKRDNYYKDHRRNYSKDSYESNRKRDEDYSQSRHHHHHRREDNYRDRKDRSSFESRRDKKREKRYSESSDDERYRKRSKSSRDNEESYRHKSSKKSKKKRHRSSSNSS